MARKHHLLRKYGITEEDYETLLHKQKGCCAVCKRPASEFRTRLCVDHDHHTRRVRGLLCTYCNRRIVGRHRRDVGAQLLKAAYEYLIAEDTEWIVPPKVKKKRKKRNVRRKRPKKTL